MITIDNLLLNYQLSVLKTSVGAYITMRNESAHSIIKEVHGRDAAAQAKARCALAHLQVEPGEQTATGARNHCPTAARRQDSHTAQRHGLRVQGKGAFRGLGPLSSAQRARGRCGERGTALGAR